MIGITSLLSYYANNPEDLVDRLGSKTLSLLPQHDSSPEMHEAANDAAILEPNIAPEDVQIPVPKVRTMEVIPETQGADIVQPRRKMVTLKVAAGWVRESHSADAKIKFLLKKRDKVYILDSKDSWYFVQLENGKQGWIHRSLF